MIIRISAATFALAKNKNDFITYLGSLQILLLCSATTISISAIVMMMFIMVKPITIPSPFTKSMKFTLTEKEIFLKILMTKTYITY